MEATSKQELAANGRTGDHGAQMLRNSLKTHSGTVAADATLNSGWITVRSTQALNTDALADVAHELGFELTAIGEGSR